MDKVERERAFLGRLGDAARARRAEQVEQDAVTSGLVCPVCRRSRLRWAYPFQEAVCPNCPGARWEAAPVVCVAISAEDIASGNDPVSGLFWTQVRHAGLTPEDRARIAGVR